jgi:hypothetical protein
MNMSAGIVAASAAALALNTSYLVQHAALSTAPVIHISQPLITLRALLASRTWVTGALLGYSGLALNILALGLAPLSLVQSIVAAGLVVVALGAAWAGPAPASWSRSGWSSSRWRPSASVPARGPRAHRRPRSCWRSR